MPNVQLTSIPSCTHHPTICSAQKMRSAPPSALLTGGLVIFGSVLAYLLKLRSAQKGVLSSSDKARLFAYLPSSTNSSSTAAATADSEQPPPHKIRLSKKRLAAFQQGKAVDVVVIGSGLGGLTVASLLSRRGYKVLVLEQHDQCGGCLHTFEEKGYEFDVGLHYVGGQVGDKRAPLRRLFDLVTGGATEWCRLDDNFDQAICTGDAGTDVFEEVNFYADYARTEKDLRNSFLQRAEKEGVSKVFRAIYYAEMFLGGWLVSKTLRPFLRRLLSPLLMLPARGIMNVTTKDKLASFADSKRFAGIFTYLYGDYGICPAASPWGVTAMVLNHWRGGAYYPLGGSSSLAIGACEVIRKSGSLALCAAPVKEIVVENGVCKGVRLEKGGDFIPARMVVSNAGVRNTYLKLLSSDALRHVRSREFVEKLQEHDRKIPEDLGGLSPSVALLSLFVGLDKSAADCGVPSSNKWVVPSWDHDKNMLDFYGDSSKPFPAVFIGSNSAKDSSYETRFGKDRGSLTVIAPVDYAVFAKWETGRVHNRGEGYDDVKKMWEDRLLKELYRQCPGCEGHVVFKDLGTPLSNNYYLGVSKGEVYGLSHSCDRTWNHAAEIGCWTDINGLFLSGQDVALAGIAGALLGGALCSAAMSTGAIAEIAASMI